MQNKDSDRRFSHSDLPIAEALAWILYQPAPHDLRRRTKAYLIAEVFVRKALRGDVRAAREVREAVEGKAPQGRRVEAPGPVEFLVVYDELYRADEKEEPVNDCEND